MGSTHSIRRVAVATALVVLIASGTVVPAASADAEPADVTELRAAIAAWGTWLGGSEQLGPMAEPLPLTAAEVGDASTAPGDLLDLAATLATALTDPLTDLTAAGVQEAHSAGDLAAAIDGLDTTVGDVDVDFGATAPDSGGDHQIALSVTLTRALEIDVRLEDAAALDEGLAVEVPVPVELSWSTSATFAVADADVVPHPAWIVAGADQPEVEVTAVVGPQPATLAGIEGAVGVADVAIDGTVDLDVTYRGVLDDPDGDGRLAFLEVASDGLTLVPGELTLAPDQLLVLARTGTAAAELDVTSTLVDLAGPVGLEVPVTDLSLADPSATATGAPADLEALAGFQRVNPFDLLSGLVQYATLLRGAQVSPEVDFELPLVSGKSSDLLDLGADLSGFIDDRMASLGTGGPEDATGTGVVFEDLVDFATIGELAALLDEQAWVQGPVAPVHDASAATLTFDLHLTKTLPVDPSPIPPVPDAANPGAFTDNPAGLAEVGSELVESTGLRALGHTGAPPARTVRTAYDVELPLVVDLAAACDTGDCATDDPETAVVEFQDPMPYERFKVPTGGTNPQIELTTLLGAPLTAAGSIGFVPVAATGTYALGQDGTAPTTAALLDATVADLPPVVRIGDLLRSLAGNPDASPPVPPTVATGTRRGTVGATFAVDAHGADPADHLTSDPGTIVVTGSFSEASATPGGPYTPTLDATAELLRALAVDPPPAPGELAPPETSALLGRILDVASGVGDALRELPAGGLSDPVPFIGAGAEDLLDELVPLAERVEAVRTGPTPVDLAGLETALEAALGIAGPELQWDLLDLAGTPSLVAQLHITKGATSSQPMRLDLGPVGELTASGLTTTISGSLDLGIVVPLAAGAPAGAPKVLRDGGLDVGASIADLTGDLEVTGHVGPFAARLGDAASKAGRVDVDVDLVAVPSAPSPTTAVAIGDYLSALTVTAEGPGTTCDPAIADAPTATGSIGCISAPLSLNGVFPSGGAAPVAGDFLAVEINGVTPADVSVALPTALDLSALASLPLSFASFNEGLDSVRAVLRSVMALSSSGAQLPFVGEDLEAAAGVLEDVDAALGGDFSFAGVPAAGETVETFLYGTVRPELATPLVAAGILRDSGYVAPSAAYDSYYSPANGASGGEDIRIVAVCKDGELCEPADPMSDVEEVTVELELGQGARDPGGTGCDPTATDTPCEAGTPLVIDLGLDGLPLRFDTTVTPDAGWTLELGIGISRTDGFFLLDNPVPGTGTPDVTGSADAGNDELRVGANVALSQQTGPEATGVLGFIEVAAEDTPPDTTDTHASGAGLLVTMGLGEDGAACTQEPTSVTGARNCTGRLIVGDLLTGGATEAFDVPVVTGGLDLDLRLEARVDGGDLSDVTALLPKFVADLTVDWAFTSDAVDATDAPDVSITVAVDATTLFDNAVGELITRLDALTDPVDPIREFLFAPVPVISDLSRMFGAGDVTYVDLAEQFGGSNLQLLRDINDVLEFIETLADATGRIELGSFQLDGELAKGPELVPGQVAALYGGLPALEGIVDDVVEALPVNSDVKKLFEKFATEPDSPFAFPALDHPECLLGLLLGEDCALVEWRPGPLEVGFEFDQSFGPFFGVIYLTLGGHATATGDLSMGFSTRGIRLLAENLLAGGELLFKDLPSSFLQSVYLGDLDPDGVDIPELTVSAGIKAGGKLSVIIAEAGVEGGIDANVDLDLRDGPVFDGLLYVDEIVDRLHNPFCLFDVTGALTAFLRVYATLGVCPFCLTESYELARVTLLEFASECVETKPVLAEVIDGEVLLNVGDGAGGRASARGPDWDHQTEESYVVRQLADNGDGTFDFSVSAFGNTQPYTGSAVRVITAGTDADSFVFQGTQAGSQAGQEPVAGGAITSFTAPVLIDDLGEGSDVAKTGDGDDIVSGGGGGDLIDLGAGKDYGHGGSGDDVLLGGADADELWGSIGDDTLDGGLGADELLGGNGHDRIQGGSDLVLVPSQPPAALDERDEIHGGLGNDTIDGGSGGDLIYGDELVGPDGDGAGDIGPFDPDDGGADRITGGGGSDTVYAGNGDDLVFGGFSDPTAGTDASGDLLYGNGGHDQLHGGDGGDELWGGSGNDLLRGDDGDDQLHGQAGVDTLRGGEDDDDLFGGSGDDALFGEGGGDDLTGDGDDAGGDPPTPGSDTLDGGPGTDLLLGDNGTVDDSGGSRTPQPSETVGAADVLRGGDGPDGLYGEGGGDTLYGGSGADLLHGNGGVDTLFGDTGVDVLWGDADDDTLHGGPLADLLYGNAGSDTAYGDAGDDIVIGGSDATQVPGTPDGGDFLYGTAGADRLYGDNVELTAGGTTVVVLHAQPAGQFGGDLLDGGPGQDELHGQDGDDTLYGGNDHDQLFGEYGSDTAYGQDGPDSILGDRGTITRPARDVVEPVGGWAPGTPLGAPELDVSLVEPGIGGADTLEGGNGDDHAWGGAGGDTLRGGFHDDYLEGNGGKDRIFGDKKGSTSPADGQDDLIGGSSPVNPLADPDGANAAPDEGELEMEGNGAEDVMAGDNAILVRVATTDGTAWEVDPVTGGHRRSVTLLDTEKDLTELAVVSGGDLMSGNDAPDRLFGQGGNDRARGNDGQDLIEGNQGHDWLEGNAGADDLIGGSSVAGQLDGSDVVHGGGGPDVLTGDNALVVRDLPGIAPAFDTYAFTYQTYQLGIEPRRGVVLHDLDELVPSTFGDDQLSGGEGVDVAFGQDGDDALSGGGGDDYQQGNGGGDTLVGDRPLSAIGVEPVHPTPDWPGAPSGEPGLSGPAEPDGQDDQIGGSNLAGHRDGDDTAYGDGAADFQLGDNGELVRTIVDGAYAVYTERHPDGAPPIDAAARRQVTEHDAGAPEGVWGHDTLYGGDGIDEKVSAGAGDGDDTQLGQDGDDLLYGEDDHDDQYGSLGADELWGGAGEDAMVGDRGGIVSRLVDGGAGDPDPAGASFDVDSPPGIEWDAWAAHPYDRRVSLTHDREGVVLTFPGLTHGGRDRMRGGPGHDSMHGAFEDDLMNGDSGGDYLLGADGADVMWGGKGNPDPASRNNPGPDGQFLDILFGGYGSSATEAGADIMDYQPRPDIDPQAWFDMTADYETADAGDKTHHHGVDWLYGGWDRDVLQGDVTANGPNDGDKLLDWNGAYNLYTHCNAAYGGWNDVRKLDPANVTALEKLAYAVGAGTSLTDVRTPGTSGFRELAMVYNHDLKHNSGRAFSTTPGHFKDFICDTD